MAFLASLVLLAASTLAQDLQITSPPSLTTCQPALLTITGANAPFIVNALPGGDPAAAPLVNIASGVPAGPLTWVVNVAAGTSISIEVRDATGAPNYSSPITVLAGPDTSCVGQAPSSAAAGASSIASSAADAASSVESSVAGATSSVAAAASSGLGSVSSQLNSITSSIGAGLSSAVRPSGSAAPSSSRPAEGAAGHIKVGSFGLAIAAAVAYIAA